MCASRTTAVWGHLFFFFFTIGLSATQGSTYSVRVFLLFASSVAPTLRIGHSYAAFSAVAYRCDTLFSRAFSVSDAYCKNKRRFVGCRD